MTTLLMPATKSDVRARVRLAPTPMAPRAVRELIRRTCVGLPQRSIDNAALVASELMVKSIKECRSSVEVQLRTDEQAITIYLFHAPRLTEAARPTAPDRYLRVLSVAAMDWGFASTETGEMAWAVIGHAAESTASDDPRDGCVPPKQARS